MGAHLRMTIQKSNIGRARHSHFSVDNRYPSIMNCNPQISSYWENLDLRYIHTIAKKFQQLGKAGYEPFFTKMISSLMF